MLWGSHDYIIIATISLVGTWAATQCIGSGERRGSKHYVSMTSLISHWRVSREFSVDGGGKLSIDMWSLFMFMTAAVMLPGEELLHIRYGEIVVETSKREYCVTLVVFLIWFPIYVLSHFFSCSTKTQYNKTSVLQLCTYGSSGDWC